MFSFDRSKLISLGHTRPLESTDIPNLPIIDNSTTVDQQYRHQMNKIKTNHPNVTNPSIPFSAWKAVNIALAARGAQFIKGGICLVLWSVCYGLQPVYVKAILVEIQLKNVLIAHSDAIALNASTYNATYFVNREQEIQSLNPLTGITPITLWIICVITGIIQVLLLNHGKNVFVMC